MPIVTQFFKTLISATSMVLLVLLLLMSNRGIVATTVAVALRSIPEPIPSVVIRGAKAELSPHSSGEYDVTRSMKTNCFFANLAAVDPSVIYDVTTNLSKFSKRIITGQNLDSLPYRVASGAESAVNGLRLNKSTSTVAPNSAVGIVNRGGRFSNLDALKEAGEVGHHMPQNASLPSVGLSRSQGPALGMTEADHALTRTFRGRGSEACARMRGFQREIGWREMSGILSSSLEGSIIKVFKRCSIMRILSNLSRNRKLGTSMIRIKGLEK